VTYNSTLIRGQQHTLSLLIYIVSFNLTPYVDLGMFMTTVNGEECLMTKLQEVSLNYHFSVEQRVGSAAYGFFGFNGKYKIYYGFYIYFVKNFKLVFYLAWISLLILGLVLCVYFTFWNYQTL
jgi:hypothetical protein